MLFVERLARLVIRIVHCAPVFVQRCKECAYRHIVTVQHQIARVTVSRHFVAVIHHYRTTAAFVLIKVMSKVIVVIGSLYNGIIHKSTVYLYISHCVGIYFKKFLERGKYILVIFGNIRIGIKMIHLRNTLAYLLILVHRKYIRKKRYSCRQKNYKCHYKYNFSYYKSGIVAFPRDNASYNAVKEVRFLLYFCCHISVCFFG